MIQCQKLLGKQILPLLVHQIAVEEKERQQENIIGDIFQKEDKTMKLDYSIESPEERNELVKAILAETPEPSQKYLEILGDYLVLCMEKQEKKQKKILTDNRMTTINKRETSFEGLTAKLENGEDGIYNLITNDKNIIFSPSVRITEKDVREIQPLRQLRESIKEIEKQIATASGKRLYSLKKTLIEMRQDQYVIKNAYRKPIYFLKTMRNIGKLDLTEKVWVDDGEVVSDGLIHLFDPDHISALICNYSELKQDTYSNLTSDARWLLLDLEDNITEALKDYPLYEDIILYKVDGCTNIEIQNILLEKYGIKHSLEYISSLYRNKIPKLIAEYNQNEWLIWHYTMEEKGKWKKCSRCGEIKLAHNRFFSKNKTSKDGYYSICKCCRNTKKTEVK